MHHLTLTDTPVLYRATAEFFPPFYSSLCGSIDSIQQAARVYWHGKKYFMKTDGKLKMKH
jgi:hypothetical protein